MSLFPVNKKRMKRPEQLLQIGIFNDLNPRMAQGVPFLAFHVPNGGGRSKVEAGILKAMGTMAGVTDIILLFSARTDSCGDMRDAVTVFVELKIIVPYKKKDEALRSPDHGMDESQIIFRGKVTALGFEYKLVAATDLPDALNQIHAIMRENGVEV